MALRLICMRQEEIESFVAREYWTVEALLMTPSKDTLTAKVVIPKEMPNEQAAHAVVETIRSAGTLQISKITRQVRSKTPLPPFITSTLQQAASSRLRYSAKKTMVLAQQLYEGLPIGGDEITGLITYMRTDSPVISEQALEEVRQFIPETFVRRICPRNPGDTRPKNQPRKPTRQSAHKPEKYP